MRLAGVAVAVAVLSTSQPGWADRASRGERAAHSTAQPASRARPEPARPVAAPRDAVLSAVRRAEAATGVDGTFLLAVGQRESRLDTTARSRRSSARGLMQFTDDTWLEAVRDFGARHGLERQSRALAEAHQQGKSPPPRLRGDVLRLRHDPQLAAAIAAARFEAWRPALRTALSREPTQTDLYLVHLLGASGAQRFLTDLSRSPRRSALQTVGRAGRANRELFVRNGRSLTLAEVYADLSRSLSATMTEVAEMRAEESPAPIQVAAR
ncbi:transglycosylase SLT domain-containing protein [Roseomonas sp. CCTCC AB2023176]|uniref:transglycosylase SLT domain-containing protein n=1 Tax=Roseomonas sp. CCTCC AB2023176 TaxID=3342640 RepID=UPI0035E03F89